MYKTQGYSLDSIKIYEPNRQAENSEARLRFKKKTKNVVTTQLLVFSESVQKNVLGHEKIIARSSFLYHLRVCSKKKSFFDFLGIIFFHVFVFPEEESENLIKKSGA